MEVFESPQGDARRISIDPDKFDYDAIQCFFFIFWVPFEMKGLV